MTKISTRHLNEIIRERNQYSRDALEAWQDFINLKGRMDTELAKVNKRNNFLVEELESWKQQFLKFQAFAEQLTKETQDLKVKIDSHKRENRRLVNAMDQHKDDTARLNVRLNGTEKQRDDALEALVLQQEIAEELERERKRNKRELGTLQQTNTGLTRQRDEAQRVVLHLRALIDGQAHHMQHIVKTLSANPEIAQTLDEEVISPAASPSLEQMTPVKELGHSSRASSRASSRPSSRLSRRESKQDMESRGFSDSTRRRFSGLSMTDVADRNLREKSDAIAYIIRNISEQCAAAVEGLHLAQRADSSGSATGGSQDGRRSRSKKTMSASGDDSDARSETSQSYLHPSRRGSQPPTPDLVHNQHRSSTSTSVTSLSTATPDRYSMQSQWRTIDEDIPEVPTQMYKHNDAGVIGDLGQDDQLIEEPSTKFSTQGLEHRNSMTLDNMA